MVQPILIGGTLVNIPGVYSTFDVANSLLAPAPAGRSVFVFGESTEGVPGSMLDITRNFYTSFDDVQTFYGSGPIVDAARQFFSTQPTATGSIFRFYPWKTNESVRATKTISSPVNFGLLSAITFGESGNSIRSQIKDGQAEVKPSKSALYLPSAHSRTFKVVVNGVATSALAVSAGAGANSFVTALSAVSGLSVTGGATRATITSGPMTSDLSASGDTLTITRASGSATFSTAILIGDVCYIPAGSDVAGTGNVNAGVFLVTAISTTSISLKQLKGEGTSAETNAAVYDLVTAVDVAAADLVINAPISFTVTATTASGSAASLEILENTADKLGAGMIVADSDLGNILVNSTSSVSNISATVPSSGKLAVSLNLGSWTQTPKAGDLIRITRDSLLAGATLKNVGLLIVESASSQAMTLSHLFATMTTEAVSSVALQGANDTVEYASGFITSTLAAKRLDSASERKVVLAATRTTDGVSMPQTLIGGNVALELSYYNAAATAATVSIDVQRKMTLDLTGSGLTDLTVNTKKYKTLQDLVDYINTQAGFSARIPDARMKTLPSSVLDMVTSVGILSGSALPDYNGKIKKDYSDWLAYFASNVTLVGFVEGGMQLKTGLPTAEATQGFLAGGVLGATSNADCQAALDDAMKVSVRIVVPLFSRDAIKDIDDGLTDVASAYSLGAILSQVQAHVSTASNDVNRKYRFGAVSCDSSFSDAIDKVSSIGYERIQFFFQRSKALDSEGNLVTFLPWMQACAVSANRLQSILGQPMLRKTFLLSSSEHVGDASLFTDTLSQDFSPDDQGQLSEAISAGLVCLALKPGFGVTMLSPDLSSRSRENDPKGWLYERVAILFTCDEIRESLQSVIENFIGNRTSDVSEALLRSSLNDVLNVYLPGSGNGALLAARVNSVTLTGNQAKASISIQPCEALESILLSIVADRSLSAS